MAIKDWRRSREQMEREAIAALAELAFGDATDWTRLDREAEACARHLADLQRGYPNGPRWGAA